jgi:DNA-binding NtrC family response regulator
MLSLKCHTVHVVVSDDQMPGMSGVELLTWVAKNFPATARIMLTGKATATSAIKAINDAKVYRYFTKPCNVVDLALTIRQALEAGSQADPATKEPTVSVGK